MESLSNQGVGAKLLLPRPSGRGCIVMARKVRLTGLVTDPDGDTVTVKWWQFKIGSYPGDVTIMNPTSLSTEVAIPPDAKPG